MNVLDLPSRKLFVYDLCHCVRSEEAGQSNKTVNWETTICAQKTVFGCVWIQGVTVQSNTKGDELFLDDSTGIVRVVGCDRIPTSCLMVKPEHQAVEVSAEENGQYVLVIGVMTGSGALPTVRAIKIQDLTSCTVAETMWMLEVIDCANTLKLPC